MAHEGAAVAAAEDVFKILFARALERCQDVAFQVMGIPPPTAATRRGGRTGRWQRFGSALAAFPQRLLRWLPAMDSTQTTGGVPWHRRMGWAAAFASSDPAQHWAAACSVAGAITAGDSWVDSTAIHEAACGAYDAAAGCSDPEAVPAAVGGARRALYWERRERMTLAPPVSLGPHRWQAERDIPSRRLEPISAARPISTDARGRSCAGSQTSELDGWLADLLDGAGWRWPVPAAEALPDAIDAVLSHGRHRARARLLEMDPELPVQVADGLVLLVAGSRPRGPRTWPGAVWLRAHHGPDAAAADPGTRAVVAAVAEGRRAHPARVGDAGGTS